MGPIRSGTDRRPGARSEERAAVTYRWMPGGGGAHRVVGSLVWEKLHAAKQRLPALFGHTCAVLHGQMVVFGGQTEAGTFSEQLFKLSPGSGKEIHRYELYDAAFAPAPRIGHTASVVGNRMFVFGGKTADGRTLNDLVCYDMGTRSRTFHVFVYAATSAERG